MKSSPRTNLGRSRCRLTHLERGRVRPSWSQELQQGLDHILLSGLNNIYTVDCPLVQLEEKGQQRNYHQAHNLLMMLHRPCPNFQPLVSGELHKHGSCTTHDAVSCLRVVKHHERKKIKKLKLRKIKVTSSSGGTAHAVIMSWVFPCPTSL